MKALKGFGIFIGTFLVYHIIFSNFFPVDENNVLQAPNWYSLVGFLIAGVVTFVCMSSYIIGKHDGRIEIITKKKLENLFLVFTNNHNAAIAANNVAHFVTFWGYAEEAHKKIGYFYRRLKSDKKMTFSWQNERLEEFQWRLRDAIERSANNTLYDIRGPQRNNLVQRASAFYNEIALAQSRFSDETTVYAASAVETVMAESGVPIPCALASIVGLREQQNNASNTPHMELQRIDFMDGHDFEYWCADLLRKLGYINVQVTRGSGDQGVDILATKEGITYAVQCKCYSSDLGNTPIQEVNAGKQIYHCHIGAVITNRYFTKGGKEAAQATGVLLWDRDWILNSLIATQPQWSNGTPRTPGE